MRPERLLADCGVGSVTVEGGAELLGAFICEGLFDEVRIERSPKKLGRGVAARLSDAPRESGLQKLKMDKNGPWRKFRCHDAGYFTKLC